MICLVVNVGLHQPLAAINLFQIKYADVCMYELLT